MSQLILLVLVVAILATVGFYFLTRKMASDMEVSTLEGLRALRKEIEAQHAREGAFPRTLDGIEIPQVTIPASHGFTNRVLLAKNPSDINDEGGWIYFNDPAVPDHWGSVRVNCTHTDSAGNVWSSY